MAPAIGIDRARGVAWAPPAAARSKWTVPVMIGVLALVLRLWAPGPLTQTQDEFAWLFFSNGFRSAVVHGDFAKAKVRSDYTTLPGVTTMWSGTFGYASVSLAHEVGLAKDPKLFAGPVLRASRAFVALWCSIALGLLVAIASLLVGRRAAAIAGVLLATEPFLVGHSDVLHTDAMVTMFGALSIVALLAGLRAGRPVETAGDATDPTSAVRIVPARARILLVALSGASAALAALTKLNAVPLVLGGGAVVVTMQVLEERRNANGAAAWWRSALEENARLAAVWGVAALLITFLVWPALWVAPLEQLRLMRVALNELKHVQHVTFFRHHLTTDPGLTYYPVIMLFRMTPWFLAGATISSFAVLFSSVRSFWRPQTANPINYVATTLLLAPVPYAIAASLISQKFDRYFLPVFPFFTIAIGVVASQAVRWLGSHIGSTRWVLPLGVVLTALLTISTLSQAPYAISYVDPLIGGQARARKNILLGWGEGLEVVGAEIRHREGNHCKDARILGPAFYNVAIPCGQIVSFASVGRNLHNLDYYVSYVNMLQRNTPTDKELYNSVRQAGRMVKAVSIDGVNYAELWKIRGQQTMTRSTDRRAPGK